MMDSSPSFSFVRSVNSRAFAFLPLVDRLGFLKAEVALEITDGQALFLSQPQNVFASRCKVNNREFGLVHKIAFFALLPNGYYKIKDFA